MCFVKFVLVIISLTLVVTAQEEEQNFKNFWRFLQDYSKQISEFGTRVQESHPDKNAVPFRFNLPSIDTMGFNPTLFMRNQTIPNSVPPSSGTNQTDQWFHITPPSETNQSSPRFYFVIPSGTNRSSPPLQGFRPNMPTLTSKCPDPGYLENGQRSNLDGSPTYPQQSYSPGHSVVFQCAEGYRRVGPFMITCLQNESWSENERPRCENINGDDQMMCAKPDEIDHGWLSVLSTRGQVPTDVEMSDYIPRTRLLVQCEEGYTVEGPGILTCDASGMWVPDPPRCIEDCGLSPLSSASQLISNGQSTKPGDFPWMVAIQQMGGPIVCGGALIDNRTVLTAAHCFDRSFSYVLHFGKYNRSNHKDDDKVFNRTQLQIIPYRYFDPVTYANDIAIVKFEPPVKYTSRVSPVCLPKAAVTTSHLMDGQTGIVTGWGTNEKRTLSGVLMMANLTYVSEEDCSEDFETMDYPLPLGHGMFCGKSLDPKKDEEDLVITTCFGDSGSPIVFLNRETYRFSVEGIVSFGRLAQCGSSKYTVFVKVSSFLHWIYRNLVAS